MVSEHNSRSTREESGGHQVPNMGAGGAWPLRGFQLRLLGHRKTRAHSRLSYHRGARRRPRGKAGR